MIRTSSFLVLCALGLGCSSSDDAPTAPTDSGSLDTGTAVEDTGTAADSATDTGTAPDVASETSAETGAGLCSDYCSKVLANCSGDTDGQYAAVGAGGAPPICAAMCVKMTQGAATDTSGDTVGCRLGFATAASSSMPGANCRKAGPYGGNACGADHCETFCKLALAQCPTSFTDAADCKTKCSAMPYDATRPEVDSTAVGKLNCVFYHLEAAYVSPATHCGHLSISPPSATHPCAP